MPLSWVARSRETLGKAVLGRVTGPDFEAHHARIWDTPGERWFRDSDAIWRVHSDAAVLVGAIRALLLQSLHPTAMHAVSVHSLYRGAPWQRLQSISRFMAVTTYGAVDDAEEAIAVVRAVHRRIYGTMPDGTPYRADDPHLLSWVHVAEVDSFLTAHAHFGTDRLTATERDDYVRQMGEVAARLGVEDPPQDAAELTGRLEGFLSELRSTDAAREACDLLLRDPPLSGWGRLGYAVLASGAVSTLPPWARAELGLPTLPVTDRVLARPVTRSALRTVRWALG